MRPEAAWSMSTVGLTAKETSFPLDNPFLWAIQKVIHTTKIHLHYLRDLKVSTSFIFCSDSEHSLNIRLTARIVFVGPKHSPVIQRLPMSRPAYLSLSCMPEPSTPSPSEDIHILSQPQSVSKGSSPPQTPSRCSKPLPPIPLQIDSCSEHSLDTDEHFTIPDESCPLVADQVIKPVRFGLGRRSLKIHGQLNRAFCDHPQTPKECHEQWHDPPRQRQEKEEILLCPRQRRVRRTQSGPAGSFNKPSLLNLQSKRNTHCTYKPETEDPRRRSVEGSGAYSDEDKPPKLPPRDPLSRGCSRTPSPKTLPLYINGEMPSTQSFAPDPKYVSYRGLQRQNSEGSPCILPIIVNGQKDSGTHYFLLDGPLPQNTDQSNSEWDFGSQRKPPVDFV
uniref:ERBB receptor feedback inhibitor 1a n=1 Tax=Neogobius melanostomus TaxID=47308 RepID=A0A8C6U1L4_9GOBI